MNVLTSLQADTPYTIMVIARGDTNQYNDSSALSIEVRTAPTPQDRLDAPATVATTVENSVNIVVTWEEVENAEEYTGAT
ncbi:MAG: hypothetical protein ACNYNY_00715 [Candidatus Oxydemutatoraceae bacterium WSBS_2016_MAG_OTU14]